MLKMFGMFSEGINKCFSILGDIEVGGFSAMSIAFVCLILSLIWRFILAPLFNTGHSFTVGGADSVSDSEPFKGMPEDVKRNLNAKWEWQRKNK